MLATLLLSAALSSPQACFWYDQLLAEGGYGRFQHERAAFLIEERDGTLTLEPWPVFGHRHARFEGAIPARAIAIVHTHPKDTPDPSARDRAEARRLGLPVIVITPRGATAAHPEGTVLKVGQASACPTLPTAARRPIPASGTTRAPSAPRTSLRR